MQVQPSSRAMAAACASLPSPPSGGGKCPRRGRREKAWPPSKQRRLLRLYVCTQSEKLPLVRILEKLKNGTFDPRWVHNETGDAIFNPYCVLCFQSSRSFSGMVYQMSDGYLTSVCNVQTAQLSQTSQKPFAGSPDRRLET